MGGWNYDLEVACMWLPFFRDLKGLGEVQTFQHFKFAKNVFGRSLYSEVD
jgi:hypothetical protein